MNMAENTLKQKKFTQKLWGSGQNRVNFITAVVAVLFVLILSVTVPKFFDVQNFANILEQISTVGFLALGMTCVMIVGGIDLSMSTVLASAAVVGATYMSKGGDTVVACLIMIGIGVGFGCINGLAVAKAKMIPFIVTLSTMMLANGFAILFTQAQSVYGLSEGFLKMGGSIGIVPIPGLIFIVFAVIIGIFLKRTKYGRWYYMVGMNENTARVSGIPTVAAKFSAYAVSGLMAGLAAITLTARLNSATTSMVGDTTTMDAIASCVIGGASLNGGKGSVIGTVLGVIFITIVGNCINLLKLSYYIGMMVKGIIIVIVIGIDVLRSRS